ncbi:MAG: DUF2145 domain-containing protein [Methylophagaceae bacterium]
MKTFKLFIAFSVLIAMFAISPVWAGSQQGGEPQFSIEEIVVLTKKVEKTMAEKGVRVFIIARNGRDPKQLPGGVNYTHVAFGVYSKIQTDDGRIIPGYAYYNLYQKDENGGESKLVTDYTIDFLANVYEAKVGIVVPTAELQKRLLGFVGSQEYYALHNPSYSVMSNPNNATYQNCTEYVLDVINASIYKTTDESKLKKIAEEHFVAQDIHISPFKILLGSMFAEGVTKSDHEGQIRTATFTTIADYLGSFNLAQEIMTIEM